MAAVYKIFDSPKEANKLQKSLPAERPQMFKGCRHFFPWGLYKWHYVDDVFKVHPSYVRWFFEHSSQLKEGSFKDYLEDLVREYRERISKFKRDNPLALSR